MSKIERIKAETDGLDVLPELLRAAKDGWETMSPEHVGLLKWYGLYAHNTGDGHFMMRVKVIQGKLSAAQVETMASIAEDFGRGVIDCTTRQCFQIHWIRLENIPEIFDRLEKVGMTTSGACGDITRNVVGCTVSGLAHDEIVDGYATSEAIHDYFLDNKLYSNLPRKYKVSVTGCAEDCARGLINDIALSAAIDL
jgi:sulfite reductase beta subunit-like hemoprotein